MNCEFCSQPASFIAKSKLSFGFKHDVCEACVEEMGSAYEVIKTEDY